MLGYTHEELVGKTLWEIGPFKDAEASQAAFRELQRKEYIRYESLPLQTKTGEHKQVEFVSNSYQVNGHTVAQCNIRDITERKDTETRVRQIHEDLVALVAELQRRAGEMKVLNRMNDMLQSCTTQAEAYEVMALTGGELFGGQGGCVAVVRGLDQHLEASARWGASQSFESIFLLEDCWALRRGQPYDFVAGQAGLMCRHIVDPPEAGYLCVPLTVQGETLGVLSLIGALGRNAERQSNDRQLAVTVGEAIKLSLSNLKLRDELREQAMNDPLTGLFNRRYLDEALTKELYSAQRRNESLCVAMVDLDHFKRFNDTFGHDAGDLLLREFGRLLRSNLRKSDIACRYGGEEFVLILPGSSLTDTSQRLQHIVSLTRELQLRHEDQALGRMTISAGVAESGEHGLTAGKLLREADEALYVAKQAGRDRVVVYTVKE
jgi:diguanylate cyclase (GGDEF)-like protein